jgi:transposase
VARELGINHETLRNWVDQLRRERRDGPAAVGGEERAELGRLRRRVAELELKKEVLRKRLSWQALLARSDAAKV